MPWSDLPPTAANIACAESTAPGAGFFVMSPSSNDQLAYAFVTPHSMRKSRTGGILGRLLSRTGLDLVAGRMFALHREGAEAFAAHAVVPHETNARHRATQELLRDYIARHFGPDADGHRQRALLLVLRGPDAVNKVFHTVGHIVHERTVGETIRDTYGDYVETDGRPTYLEPAVLAAPTAEAAADDLRLLASLSDSDGGLLADVIPHPAGAEVQNTLVLIKPDNFRFPNARPGQVMDLFSRTGLNIVGFKVFHMSVAQAEEFYGPVLDVLQDKLKAPTGARAKLAIEQELSFSLPAEVEKQLGDLLGPLNGRQNWETIVQFMAGRRPSDCKTAEEKAAPGTEKCVAIVYQGVDAVRKIREVLGPTDPSKAGFGTIRKEFGVNIMVNAAHASDAPENARREMGLIRITENDFCPLIEKTYGALEG